MGKKYWLQVLCVCALLAGCSSAADEAPATQVETTQSASVCEAAPEMVLSDAGMEETSPRSGIYIYEGDTDAVKTDSLTYFSFTEKASTCRDETGEPILMESLSRASFYSQCEIQTQWVNGILSDLEKSDDQYSEQLLEYAKQDQRETGEDFYCHSHYVKRGVARHDESVISLLTLASVYSGGLQPSNIQMAYNLDMNRLRTMTLEDVIEPEGTGKLYDLLVKKVEEKFSSLSQNGLSDDYQSIISDALTYGNMTPYWYFNDRGLVIYFNQYELAAYAEGIVKIEMEYADLAGILKEDYFPEKVAGWVTNVALEKETDSKLVYDVFLGEGETVYITLKGKATQVQLSEVRFAEHTPVDSTMLFSANRLNDETTLAVTFSADPEITYAIEFFDTGGQKVIYIKDGKVILS